ncbi:MAG: hypothetical protein AABX47_00225 [Nanoarchaeota archaeon]
MRYSRLILITILLGVLVWYLYSDSVEQIPTVNRTAQEKTKIKEVNESRSMPPPARPDLPEKPNASTTLPPKDIAEPSRPANITRKFDPMGFHKRPISTICGAGSYNDSSGMCDCFQGAVLIDRRCKTLTDLCGHELFTYDVAKKACGRDRDCQEIDIMEWRDDCLMLTFVDPMDCNKLQKSDNKKRCNERFIASQPVASIPCERITEVKQRDICLLTLGQMALDERICAMIDRSGRKDDCLAAFNSAMGSCVGIETAIDQAACYTLHAIKSRNPLICDRISDRSLKKACQVQAKRGAPASLRPISDFSGVTLVS